MSSKTTKHLLWRALQGSLIASFTPLIWLGLSVLAGGSGGVGLPSIPAYTLFVSAAMVGGFCAWLGAREMRLALRAEELDRIAVTDHVTGLKNVRYFHARLAEACAHAERSGEPLSVVMLDLDDFKEVNDRFGHPEGDHTLRVVGGAIRSVVRRGETACRVGGEEFALLLPGARADGAREVAERVRAAIRERTQDDSARITTASAGIASTDDLVIPRPDDLYRAADSALLDAKRSGKDRVSWPPPGAGLLDRRRRSEDQVTSPA